MVRQPVFAVALLACAFFSASNLPAQNVAAAPPLGWNSWDAYGLTIDEADYRANATVLAGTAGVRLGVCGDR